MNRYLRNAIYKKNDIPYSLKKTDSNWDGFETKELCFVNDATFNEIKYVINKYIEHDRRSIEP
jgi:hypothetical protein